MKQKKTKPEGKGKLLPMLSDSLEAFLPATRMEITSNREAIVEGCRGVIEYTPEQIRLAGDKITLRFRGTGLEIRNLTTQSAVVTGSILSVDFLL